MRQGGRNGPAPVYMPSNHSIVIDAALTCDDMDFIMLTVDEYGTARPQGSAWTSAPSKPTASSSTRSSDPSTAPDSRRVGDNACMSAILVLCCCPDEAVGERIGSALVEERLAACVNRISGIASTYRWQGEGETRARMPAADQDFE